MGEETDRWDNYPASAWSIPSRAVIACDGNGHGVVLHAAGPAVRMEMEEGGVSLLGDMGLDDAPPGISVWEGKSTFWSGTDTDSGYGELVGAFCTPTDEEWAAIRENRCPWNDNDWRK